MKDSYKTLKNREIEVLQVQWAISHGKDPMSAYFNEMGKIILKSISAAALKRDEIVNN